MSLYDRVADLPLSIEANERTSRRRQLAGGRTRVTSTFALLATDTFGAGEDVTHDPVDHDVLPDPPAFDFTGDYTLEAFSRSLDEMDLFPEKPPVREESRSRRRWALESAALDLALKQNDVTLASLLDRERSPVRFVASTPLPNGDVTRVRDVLAVSPGCEFKLELTDAWTEETVAALADTDAVRIVDLNGHPGNPAVESASTSVDYRRVFEAFPDAIVEDPSPSEDVRASLAANADRVSWGAPVRDVDDLRELPFAPRWCVVTPSRLGTVESLLEVVEYCEAEGIDMYGGGESELCVGRGHVQLLASLFYPDGPNDVAPGGYNDPDVQADLPTSPLDAPTHSVGLSWD